MSDRPLPVDQPARTRIATDLDTTLFVEAGAGAGKTTSLVGRIVALVASGIGIDSIAAITFTEKAAAELRHRVRQVLEGTASTEHDPSLRARYETALDRLDHAPIGTLHAFARRLLNEFPIAAGLPPGFTVLDELESNLAFDERWEDLLDRLLDEAEPAEGPVAGGSSFVQLCKFEGFGLTKGLRRVANDFHTNWDLVDERVDREPPPPLQLDVAPLIAHAIRVSVTDCPVGDSQAVILSTVGEIAAQLGQAQSLLSTLQNIAGLAAECSKAASKGNKANWKQHGGPTALEALRVAHADLAEHAATIVKQATSYRKHLVGATLSRWVLGSAAARAREGTLEFHDLLVLARRLLRSSESVRHSLHTRYQRLLLDEFQDTDPIQLAIAVTLTAAPDDSGHSGNWAELRPLPGRLFIVGDPKQSIYRFRRADIAQYLRAADQVGAEREFLTANFRSSQAVIDWVNETFSELIQLIPDTQPGYHPLSICRSGNTQHGTVHVLGIDEHTDLPSRGGAEQLRGREAADVAATVASALQTGWLVEDDATHELRACRPGDITILLPARTSLPALEAALRALDLPYRAENSSVVYTTNEIRHVMLALRAADDATDGLALVAALRTGLYGCSDVELYEWKHAGGSWSIWREAPEGFENHPVAAGIRHIRTLAERAVEMPPADLVAALIDERRMLDAALDSRDARDVWRRVRYVIEQARAWSDAGGHGLRRYLAWVHLQATEARAADSILPEHDHDAVRVMTVHAAKGLEFPITIVSGLTTRPISTGGYSVAWPGDTWALAHRSDEIFEDFRPIDEEMSDAERRRLLYVACTRAVDHLVVSLHRLTRKRPDPTKLTSAELLHSGGAADAEAGAQPFRPDGVGFVASPAIGSQLDWADRAEWESARAAAFDVARQIDTISPTALAQQASPIEDSGLAKEPVDLDLPPWQRGRYGTAVGRAVHAVLQFADLRTGVDIANHAAAQCAAEGVLGMDETVAALARSAIAAPVVQRSLALPHHRELFIAANIGGRVLEGYVDLFVQTPEGGLIVDYKTDQWPDDSERASRIERYRLQLAAYGVALEQILGKPVIGGMLVRCRPDGPAEEIEIPRWAEALTELRAAISN